MGKKLRYVKRRNDHPLQSFQKKGKLIQTVLFGGNRMDRYESSIRLIILKIATFNV